MGEGGWGSEAWDFSLSKAFMSLYYYTCSILIVTAEKKKLATALTYAHKQLSIISKRFVFVI